MKRKIVVAFISDEKSIGYHIDLIARTVTMGSMNENLEITQSVKESQIADGRQTAQEIFHILTAELNREHS